MNTFSRVAIAALTMVGVAGVAGAQTKTPEKAPAPAPAPAAPKTPAPAPAAKAPTPAPAPAPAAAPAAKAEAPKAPAMPPPPAEIAEMAKTAAGWWRCKGDEWDDKGAKAAMTATNTVKLELDKWWIVETMEAKGRMKFKMVAYTTYDATSKKWRRIAMMNGGGHMIGTSDGVKDFKMQWNLDVMGPMGAGMMREYIDMTDLKKTGLKGWGEISMDKGKTWNKIYEMTCKK